MKNNANIHLTKTATKKSGNDYFDFGDNLKEEEIIVEL